MMMMMRYTQFLARPRFAFTLHRSSRWPSSSFVQAQSFSSSGKDDDSDDDPVVEIVTRATNSAVTRASDQVLNYPHVVVVPALRRPLFPGVVLPMTITNPELSKALLSLKEHNRPYVGVFLQKNPEGSGISKLDDIHSVGSFARIDNILSFDEHSTQVLMVAQSRIRIDELYENGPPLRVKIHSLEHPEDESTDRYVHLDIVHFVLLSS